MFYFEDHEMFLLTLLGWVAPGLRVSRARRYVRCCVVGKPCSNLSHAVRRRLTSADWLTALFCPVIVGKSLFAQLCSLTASGRAASQPSRCYRCRAQLR